MQRERALTYPSGHNGALPHRTRDRVPANGAGGRIPVALCA